MAAAAAGAQIDSRFLHMGDMVGIYAEADNDGSFFVEPSSSWKMKKPVLGPVVSHTCTEAALTHTSLAR